MNTKSIKARIRRLLTSLRFESPTVIIYNTCEQMPLLSIKEETKGEDKFPNDFSFENTAN